MYSDQFRQYKFQLHTSNSSIICVTLNTELDTLLFVKVDGPTEGPTKEYVLYFRYNYCKEFHKFLLIKE